MSTTPLGNAIRKDFPFFTHHPHTAYLDSGATSLTPSCVLETMDTFYQEVRASAHRGLYKESEKATMLLEEARATVARFIGVEKEEIVFTASATASANMLAYSLEQTLSLEEGDEIVVSVFDHHALFLPFQQLAKRTGCVFKILPREKYTIAHPVILSSITERTKVVCMSLVSNVTGTCFDVEENDRRRSVWSLVRERAEEVGALTVLDATACIGHAPLEVSLLKPDFLFFSGHKMLGPQGIGVLYGKKEKLATLSPGFFGGGMVADVSQEGAIWKQGVERFEAGTHHTAGILGLARACEYLESIGLEAVEAHIEKLVRYAEEKLLTEEGVTLFSAPFFENVGVVAFTLKGVHPHDVAEVCAQEGVAIRAGHHCAIPLHKDFGVQGSVRASVHLYSTEDDIDRLIVCIKKTNALFLANRIV